MGTEWRPEGCPCASPRRNRRGCHKEEREGGSGRGGLDAGTCDPQRPRSVCLKGLQLDQPPSSSVLPAAAPTAVGEGTKDVY